MELSKVWSIQVEGIEDYDYNYATQSRLLEGVSPGTGSMYASSVVRSVKRTVSAMSKLRTECDHRFLHSAVTIDGAFLLTRLAGLGGARRGGFPEQRTPSHGDFKVVRWVYNVNDIESCIPPVRLGWKNDHGCSSEATNA